MKDEKLLLEVGKKIIFMDMVNVYILMVKNISDFINMIKKVDLVFFIGGRKNTMWDFGTTGNKMDWGNLLREKVLNMVYGKKERKKNGLIMKKNLVTI